MPKLIKMKKYYFYYALIVSVIVASCKKQNDSPTTQSNKLPPPTQIGANVVAWYTDSISYIATNSGALGTVDIDASNCCGSLNTGTFRIQTAFIDKAGYKRALAINCGLPNSIPFPIANGTSFGISPYSSSLLYEEADPEDIELTLGATGGQVVVTRYDLSKKIISGTFTMTTLSHPSIPSRTISGWFDLSIYLQQSN